MLAIQITTNVFILAAAGILCLVLGFLLRRGQLQKSANKIIELEKEMLRNNAEIIDLHRQIDLIRNQDSKTGATILKLNDTSLDDSQNVLTDVSGRKKMLGKTSNLK